MGEHELYAALLTGVPILLLAVFVGDTPLKLASNKKAQHKQKTTKVSAALLLWTSIVTMLIAAWVLGGKEVNAFVKFSTGVSLGMLLGMTFVVGYASTIGKEVKEYGCFDKTVTAVGFALIFGLTIAAMATA